jgi:hypothetical protein
MNIHKNDGQKENKNTGKVMQLDRKQYIERVARTSPDIEFSGVTGLTRDEDEAIVHIANPLNSRKDGSP